LTNAVEQTIEKKLAKISEDENFLNKNRYRVDQQRMHFADKKRMPVDVRKVKDILKNRPAVVSEIRSEI
jgi:hypothetical protein